MSTVLLSLFYDFLPHLLTIKNIIIVVVAVSIDDKNELPGIQVQYIQIPFLTTTKNISQRKNIT